MDKADGILSEMGEKMPVRQDAIYATKFFCEYEIDGVNVDAMAGFAIRHAGGVYAYCPDFAAMEVIDVQGAAVPLCPFSDWAVLYRLMGRMEKAEMIEETLRANAFT